MSSLVSVLVYYHGSRKGNYKVRSMDVRLPKDSPSTLLGRAVKKAYTLLWEAPQPTLSHVTVNGVDGEPVDSWKKANLI